MNYPIISCLKVKMYFRNSSNLIKESETQNSMSRYWTARLHFLSLLVNKEDKH